MMWVMLWGGSSGTTVFHARSYAALEADIESRLAIANSRSVKTDRSTTTVVGGGGGNHSVAQRGHPGSQRNDLERAHGQRTVVHGLQQARGTPIVHGLAHHNHAGEVALLHVVERRGLSRRNAPFYRDNIDHGGLGVIAHAALYTKNGKDGKVLIHSRHTGRGHGSVRERRACRSEQTKLFFNCVYFPLDTGCAHPCP